MRRSLWLFDRARGVCSGALVHDIICNASHLCTPLKWPKLKFFFQVFKPFHFFTTIMPSSQSVFVSTRSCPLPYFIFTLSLSLSPNFAENESFEQIILTYHAMAYGVSHSPYIWLVYISIWYFPVSRVF